MAECTCPWEATIKKNQNLLTGNGGKGLVREVEKMKVEMEHTNEHLGELSRNYGILAKSMQDINVKEKVEMKLHEKKIELKQKRSDLFKRAITIVGTGATIIGVAYLILDHI
jgi:hypothetical protein